MSVLTESYLSVDYSHRPCKQVERRMLVDALLLLSEAGYSIRDYHYLGMGSFHFVDFAMFHKYLGIHSMLSVELSSSIEKRVRFNAPYMNVIRIETGKPIGDIVANIPKDSPYVLWLDYDNVLSPYMLEDLSLAATKLCNGSVLLVTVDTEPPGDRHVGKHISKNFYDVTTVKQYYEQVAGDYVMPNRGESEFEYDALPAMNVRAIANAIKAGESGRAPDEPQFRPLFNFEYADGHRMLTAGGIILSQSDYEGLKRTRLGRSRYTRWSFTDEPCRIRVPRLTRKEQMYLDQNMPRVEAWRPEQFELSDEDLEQYAEIYRFFPAYAELYM